MLLMTDILNGKTGSLDKAQISWTGAGEELAREHSRQFYFLFVIYDAAVLQMVPVRNESKTRSHILLVGFLPTFSVSVYTYSGIQGKVMTFTVHGLKYAGST